MNEDFKSKVAELQRIKAERKALDARAFEIELELPDMVIFENSDSTWTRFIKTDNLAKMIRGESVYKNVSFSQFSTEVKILKNLPKELK